MQLSEHNKALLTGLSDEIWGYSELKFAEERSAAAMVKLLEAQGFSVETGMADLPTCYVASYGSGKPIIGILAEYDALSGLSQQADRTEKCPAPERESGHGCGHHLLGTAAIGAGLAVQEYLKNSGKSGTVKVIGCPGEEGGSGKAYMARAGVFDDLDIALTWHPASANFVATGSFLANTQAYFKFKGISSHAAASPHLGRSALDALELMNIGTNFLREHMEDSDRIHYAIINGGGTSPNVVQAEAEVLYLIRSTTAEKVSALYERVQKIARGAAMMTETEVELVFDKACSSVISNSVVEDVLYQSFKETPTPTYTEDELAYAAGFKATLSSKDITSDPLLKLITRFPDLRKKLIDNPMCDFVAPHQHLEITVPGSSDVGDVSYVVPTAQIMTACYAVGTPAHSWQMVAQGKAPIAHKGMLFAADVMAKACTLFYEDTGLVEKAKTEFLQTTEGKPYICPIPAEVKPAKNPR